jgi:Uma2 family endonuclease
MAIPKIPRYTVEQYLRMSSASETKLEYRDGEIIDMAGATYNHNRITANLLGELRNKLKGSSCEATGGDTRVLAADDRYCYPDVVVVCGGPMFDPRDPEMTITNPLVLIEVMSPSTEATDRSEKLIRYINIESLQEYVLVSQSGPKIESYLRNRQGAWTIGPVARSLEHVASFGSLNIEISLREIYANVSF